ncbi:MAG TPA: M48 family metallopeptidase [Gammaproteobacteria bacterium]|nr:M48 family metallopeptidase [Gammaproteobacteria bacterium]
MIANTPRTWIVALSVATLTTAAAGVAAAQTQFKPGFNLFSPEQDQEIGRQSADAAERQLPILEDQSIEAYIDRIGARLATVAPGAEYRYQFKVVNASDINAFALPGGYLYVNRGLVEAAQNEGQLAGVMAHEMAHVALRHGTSQASKAYVAQTGLGLLGGLVGKDDPSAEQRIAALGGFGLNTLFLKFSRTAEEQADITGAQMMAEAGYDPADMVDFFEILVNEQNRNPGKVAQFFSSHPAPANRAARINEEIELLAVRPIRPIGGFAQVKSELGRMRPAASMQQIAQRQSTPAPAPRSGNDRSVPEIKVDGPSSEFSVFAQRDGLFEIGYPENWHTYAADHGYGVIIAPDGGYVDAGGRERDLISGVIVNQYDPFEDDRSGEQLVEGNTSLVRATNDLLGTILRTNPEMEMVRDSERRNRIDGAPSLSVVLSGRSPVTRQEERVTLFTREVADDQIIYALFIAAERDYQRLNETFNRMISSLTVSTDATRNSNARGDDDRSVSGRNAVVPAGTVLMVGFQERLSSATSRAGDRFTAELVEPVRVNRRVAIPAGSVISGRVLSARPAARFGSRRAQLNLEFTSLRIGSGRDSPISASFHEQGASQTRRDATTIGAAAAAGAVIGHVLGEDRKDMVLGALVGGAIGTGIAARNRGEEVTLPEGIAVEIHLDAAFGG